LYGYIQEGLWQSQADINKVLFRNAGDAKVGRFRFKDLNGDGQIDNNDETYLGSPIPTLLLGLNLTANYKNWDFTMYWSGTYGNKLFNFVKYFTHFNAFQRNRSKDFLYEAGKTLPVIDGGDNYSSQRNSYYVEDGSFLRIQRLAMYYDFDSSLLKRLKLSKLSVGVSANNIWTLTKYTGLDPMVGGGADTNFGIDVGNYPVTPSYMLNFAIGF
jgi:hypothetical protein